MEKIKNVLCLGDQSSDSDDTRIWAHRFALPYIGLIDQKFTHNVNGIYYLDLGKLDMNGVWDHAFGQQIQNLSKHKTLNLLSLD